MIELAQSEPGTPVLPKQLDTDPWKLNVSNGMIDLNTGLLHEHNRDDLITKISPVNYTPGKRSELFDNFLNRVISDNEVKSFIQRVAGYSLYGRNVEEIMLFVYGPPASGKSTFLDAISAAMGDYAARTDFGSFLKREWASGGPRADIARLAGKRLVISQEVEEGAKLDEALVNQLTGMDTVAARHLYQESFEFLPQFTIWLAANSRPQLSSADGGIWRRIREIPFNEVIPENERDRELKDMFCEPEHNKAILNWMVEGCLAWQRQGLSVPCAVKEATDDYREEMDYVGQFMDECTYRGAGLSEGNSNLYNVYMDWCKYNRVPKLGRKSFSQNLKDRGLQQRPGKRDGRCWDGIKLRLEALSDFQLNKRFLGHLRAREKVGCD